MHWEPFKIFAFVWFYWPKYNIRSYFQPHTLLLWLIEINDVKLNWLKKKHEGDILHFNGSSLWKVEVKEKQVHNPQNGNM